MNSPQYTDSNYSEDEGLEDYKIDGYHPVHVGEILLDRYVIMQKLGYGHFSTAWLALDNNNGNYVAIKIQKSDERYIQGAYDEIEILQALAKKNFDKEWISSLREYYKDDKEKLKELETVEHTQVVQLLNSFIHNGQNGKHFCMVFEVMGVTLLEIIKRYNYKGIPLPLVRIITKQILIGLDFLHRICHIIHTDLKPENVLVCLTPDELRNIQETGTYVLDTGNNKESKTASSNVSVDEKDSINNSILNEVKVDGNLGLSMSISLDTSTNFSGLTGKKLRKKRQKFKKKQMKILENYGLSKKEIKEKMDEIMDSKKSKEIEIDINNYDLEDLIERPRIASVPKVNLDLFSHEKEKKPKKNKKKSAEEESEDLEDSEDVMDFYEKSQPDFDINLLEYSKTLQGYIKEKNRILHDENYRRFVLTRNDALSKAKTDEEKIAIYRKLNEEYGSRGKEIDPSIEVKICDIGNACWFNYHFSTIIQTRQYRSPEVLIGVNYNETSDIWSLACIIFELVTGDFLFQPEKGETFTKNDDHVAKFMQTLGKMPKNFAKRGEYYNKFFTKEGKMRRVKEIKYVPLKDILVKKYHFKENEAQALTDFLLPMLEFYPESTIELIPAYERQNGIMIEFFGDEVDRICEFDVVTGAVIKEKKSVSIFPASHFVTSDDKLKEAVKRIQDELEVRRQYFLDNNKLIEEQRIRERVNYDTEMLLETGFCRGVENYSRHLALRGEGETPTTLIDFFSKDFLLVVDESHVTLPQVKGMYNGDRARKQNLVDYGFRLPSALDKIGRAHV